MVSSRLLDTLPQRPPTPPRDAQEHVDIERGIDAALSVLGDSFDVDIALNPLLNSKTLVDTPRQSPIPAAGHAGSSGAKATKRVDFSPWNQYNGGFGNSSRSPGTRTPIKTLPPSRQLKPRRSILKPFAPSPSPTSTPKSSPDKLPLCSSRTFVTFSDMIDAVVEQLAPGQRELSLDAYATLLGNLRGERSDTDVEAIQSNLGRFCEFLRRDLSPSKGSTSALDTSSITQACKVLCGLIQTPAIGDAIPDEFCSWLLCRCIAVLEDQSLPKAVVTHFMFLLHEQNFSPRVVTVDRVQRLMNGLQFIDDRIKGNSIIGTRIYIYKKFAEQVPDLMLLRMPEWLEHLFHAMLSSNTDLRLRAIQAGLSIAMAIGHKKEASLVLDALFKHPGADDKTYGHYVCDRLVDMLEPRLVTEEGNAAPNIEESRSVPQIWRVVILFLAYRRHRIESWRYLKLWLNIIQKCFNSKDVHTKYQANIAWNTLVYVVMPDKETPSNLVSMLKIPLLPQLSSRGRDKSNRNVRKFALSSCCNLLYYALRPTASPAEKTTHWTAFANPVLETLAKRSVSDADTACNMLYALFGGFEPRMWNETRVHESPHVMSLHELPAMDPKWIRQNIKIVLDAVRPVLKDAQWTSAGRPLADLPVGKMWLQLMVALQQAGIKEITASQELRECIASLVNLLDEMWCHGGDALAMPARFQRFLFLTESATRHIGPMHFANQLLKKPAESGTEAAPASAHAQNRPGSLESPMEHLWISVGTHPNGFEFSGLSEMLTFFASICLDEMSDKQVQRTFLGGLTATFKASHKIHTTLASQVWHSLARMMTETLAEPASSTSPAGAQSLEPAYRAILRIFRSGLYLFDSWDLDVVARLYSAAAKTMQHEVGVGSSVILIVRPLCKELGGLLANAGSEVVKKCLELTGLFLNSEDLHASTRDMKLAQRKLLGDASRTAQDVAPHQPLLAFLGSLSLAAYHSCCSSIVEALASLLHSLSSLLKRLSPTSRVEALSTLQSGFCCWISDEDCRLEQIDRLENGILRRAVRAWYDEVLGVIAAAQTCDSRTLASFQGFIVAGLSSRRKSIVNTAVNFWNSTFGRAESLQYPDRVKESLQRLRNVADLELPTFPILYADDSAGLPELESSDADSNEDHGYGRPAIRSSSPFPQVAAGHARASKSPLPRLGTFRLHSASKSKSTPRKKLRHEDSQIEFETINSSPPDQSGAAESQHLTEHQKEVAERQRGDANHIFTDISIPSSVSVPRSAFVVARKGDLERAPPTSFRQVNEKLRSFSNKGEDEEPPSTPRISAPGLLSDDLPGSSPTPASAPDSRARTPALAARRDALKNDEFIDPPSSPPRDRDRAPEESGNVSGDKQITQSGDGIKVANSEDGPHEAQSLEPANQSVQEDEQFDPDDMQDDSRSNVPVADDAEAQDPASELSEAPSASSVDPSLPAAQIEAEHRSFLEQQEREVEHVNADPEQQDLNPDPVSQSEDVPREDEGELGDIDELFDAFVSAEHVEETSSGQDVHIPGTAEAVTEKEPEAAGPDDATESVLDSFVGVVAPGPPSGGYEGLESISHDSSPARPELRSKRKATSTDRDNHKRLKHSADETAEDLAGEAKPFQEATDGEMLDCIVVTPRRGASSRGNERPAVNEGSIKAPPRRRGRPRKSEGQTSRAGSQTSQSAPKRRGRPPKKQTTRSSGTAQGFSRRLSISNRSTASSQDKAETSQSALPRRTVTRRSSKLSETSIPVATEDVPPRPDQQNAEPDSPADPEVLPTTKELDHVSVQVQDTPALLPPSKRRKTAIAAENAEPLQQDEHGLKSTAVGSDASRPESGDAIQTTSEMDATTATRVAESSAEGSRGQDCEDADAATPSRKRKHNAIDSESEPRDACLTPTQHRGEAAAGDRLQTPSQAGASSPIRRILSPSSILEGLKKILNDCKGVVLGREQVRQADDVMYEIRSELYAGERRGRRAG